MPEATEIVNESVLPIRKRSRYVPAGARLTVLSLHGRGSVMGTAQLLYSGGLLLLELALSFAVILERCHIIMH
jgi:hypothetical protein